MSAQIATGVRPVADMPATGGDGMLRDLIGAVVLLLLIRAAEPLFFGEGYFATLSSHPYWIVVILASVQGGIFMGIATAAAAIGLMDWPPRPVGVDITAHFVELAIVPVQWLLAAIVIGMFSQERITRQTGLVAEIERLQDMNDALAVEIERLDQEIATLELEALTRDEADPAHGNPAPAPQAV